MRSQTRGGQDEKPNQRGTLWGMQVSIPTPCAATTRLVDPNKGQQALHYLSGARFTISNTA
eukprot:366332-Chlamydomonas_euryale.AAC.7